MKTKNHKDLLFELIRKEEVIIWAGAGLSFYAGYPSGNKLSQIIYENLTPKEKKEVNRNLPLPFLTEEYYRIKGNDMSQVYQILRETFNTFKPTSTDCHEKIASIPHFKTIITTNYDNLFENCYKEKAQVVISSFQIPKLKNDMVHIFKIHGDLSDENTIILKNSDYEHFFTANKESEIFWTTVKDRIATKSILFLGYNIEDINTRVLFQRITNTLKEHRKPWFMVSPKLPKQKLSDLKLNNIFYIESTAQIFIDELIENIKRNIYQDFEYRWVSVNTLKDFIFHYNVLPELKIQDGFFKLLGLKGIKGTESKMNLTFKADENFIMELQDFTSGKKVGTLEIDSTKMLKYNFDVGGINWPVFNQVNKLVIKSIPKQEKVIDIRFENGFEMNNLYAKLYGSFPYFEIHISLKSGVIKTKFKLEKDLKTDIDFSYTHNEFCTKIKDEIEQFEFLKCLGSGIKFSIFRDDGKLVFSEAMPIQKNFVDESIFYIEYFSLLKKIESHFNLVFPPFSFSSINDETYKLILNISAIIKNEKLTYYWDKVQKAEIFDHSKGSLELVKKVNQENAPIAAFINEEEKIQLHGVEINLGYKRIVIVQPFIVNLEKVLSKDEKEIKIISKEKKILVYYSKDDK